MEPDPLLTDSVDNEFTVCLLQTNYNQWIKPLIYFDTEIKCADQKQMKIHVSMRYCICIHGNQDQRPS